MWAIIITVQEQFSLHSSFGSLQSSLSCPSHLLMHRTSPTPTHPSTTYFSEPKQLNFTRENHTRQMASLLTDHADQSQSSWPAWYSFPKSTFSHCLQHLFPTFLQATQTSNFPLTLSWGFCSIHPKEKRSHHTGTPVWNRISLLFLSSFHTKLRHPLFLWLSFYFPLQLPYWSPCFYSHHLNAVPTKKTRSFKNLYQIMSHACLAPSQGLHFQ